MSDRVTDAQAAEWRALCEAATEGPWRARYLGGGRDAWVIRHVRAPITIDADPSEMEWAARDNRPNVSADARFIAATPTIVRGLLDEREELCGQLKAVAGASEYWLQQFEHQRAYASVAEEVVAAARALKDLNENVTSDQFNAHSWNSALRRLFRTVEGLER